METNINWDCVPGSTCVKHLREWPCMKHLRETLAWNSALRLCVSAALRLCGSSTLWLCLPFVLVWHMFIMQAICLVALHFQNGNRILYCVHSICIVVAMLLRAFCRSLFGVWPDLSLMLLDSACWKVDNTFSGVQSRVSFCAGCRCNADFVQFMVAWQSAPFRRVAGRASSWHPILSVTRATLTYVGSTLYLDQVLLLRRATAASRR